MDCPNCSLLHPPFLRRGAGKGGVEGGVRGEFIKIFFTIKGGSNLLESFEVFMLGLQVSELLCCGCRSEALQVVLDAASGSHADTRNKAVRLIANKLFAQPQLQDTIAAFARQMLFKLAATAGIAATAAATDASTTAVVSAEQPTDMPLPQDPSSDAPASLRDPSTVSQAPPSSEQHQYQSEEDGTRFAGLFCALCTKQQTLLRDLLLVYGRASEGSKSAIEAVAAGTDPCFDAMRQ